MTKVIKHFRPCRALLLLLLGAFIPALAAETQEVVVSQGDEEVCRFSLESEPYIEMTSECWVATDGTNEINLPLSESYIVTIEEKSAGIQLTQAETLSISLNGKAIVLSGLANGDQVALCNLGGRVLATATGDAQGCAILSHQGSGMIILSTPKGSFKINRK
ncbi:MAG: hypothetical protein LIP03_11280 [Bacteroidales bacterium]|nr:hypothetical protein [Bacteroidales bacterium]